MLSKKINITRVKALGFIEVCLALIPLAPSSCDIPQRFRYATAIWQKLACLLEITHCRVVILRASVMVISHGIQRLAKVRLKRECGFGC